MLVFGKILVPFPKVPGDLWPTPDGQKDPPPARPGCRGKPRVLGFWGPNFPVWWMRTRWCLGFVKKRKALGLGGTWEVKGEWWRSGRFFPLRVFGGAHHQMAFWVDVLFLPFSALLTSPSPFGVYFFKQILGSQSASFKPKRGRQLPRWRIVLERLETTNYTRTPKGAMPLVVFMWVPV